MWSTLQTLLWRVCALTLSNKKMCDFPLQCLFFLLDTKHLTFHSLQCDMYHCDCHTSFICMEIQSVGLMCNVNEWGTHGLWIFNILNLWNVSSLNKIRHMAANNRHLLIQCCELWGEAPNVDQFSISNLIRCCLKCHSWSKGGCVFLFLMSIKVLAVLPV